MVAEKVAKLHIMMKTGLIGDQFSSKWCHFSTTITLFNQVIHHNDKSRKLSVMCIILFTFAVRAAEETAAGSAGTPRGEEEAEALGRTPEQRPRERLGRQSRKRRRERPVLRGTDLTHKLCPGWTTEASPAPSSAHVKVF